MTPAETAVNRMRCTLALEVSLSRPFREISGDAERGVREAVYIHQTYRRYIRELEKRIRELEGEG